MSQVPYPTFAKTLALARERINALFLRADVLNVTVEEAMDLRNSKVSAPALRTPVPAYSKLAISIRGALFGFDHPSVVAMADRNQMLRAIAKFGFALPEVAG